MTWNNLADRMLRMCLKTFADPEIPITYRRGAVSVSLSEAVFDANYIAVDPETGAQITSVNPMIGVRLADLPDGEARQGDEVIRGGFLYRVVDKQPDSEGHAKLILHKVGAA